MLVTTATTALAFLASLMYGFFVSALFTCTRNSTSVHHSGPPSPPFTLSVFSRVSSSYLITCSSSPSSLPTSSFGTSRQLLIGTTCQCRQNLFLCHVRTIIFHAVMQDNMYDIHLYIILYVYIHNIYAMTCPSDRHTRHFEFRKGFCCWWGAKPKPEVRVGLGCVCNY